MEIWLIGLAILFAGLAIAIAIASGAGRTQAHNEQAARIGDQIVGVRDAHTALTERLQALAEAHATSQAMLTKLLEERLDKVSQRMGQISMVLSLLAGGVPEPPRENQTYAIMRT